MTDIPSTSPTPESDHAWVHENLAAYLAGGLDAGERTRFDGHINSCPTCFDAYTEARDADRALQRTLGALSPQAGFEDRITRTFRESAMRRYVMIRRAGYAAAACVALAATGVFANYVLHRDGGLNNPLSRMLIARADERAPQLSLPVDKLASTLRLGRARELSNRAVTAGLKAQAAQAGEKDEEVILGTFAQADKKDAWEGVLSIEQRAKELQKEHNVWGFDGGSVDLFAGVAREGQIRRSSEFAQAIEPEPAGKARLQSKGLTVNGADQPSEQSEVTYDQILARSRNAPVLADTDARRKDTDSAQDPLPKETRVVFDITGGGGLPTNQTSTEYSKSAPSPGIGSGYLAFNDMAGKPEAFFQEGRYSGGTRDSDDVGFEFGAKTGRTSELAKQGTGNLALSDSSGVDRMGLGTVNENISGTLDGKLGVDGTRSGVSGPDGDNGRGRSGPTDELREEMRPPVVGDMPMISGQLAAAATQPARMAPEPVTPDTPGTPGTAAGTQPGTPTPPAAVSSLKIIRNGTLTFEVRSFDDTYMTISQVAEEERGFIASTSSDKLANGKVRGIIVVRVPPERLERFLLKIRALGDLKAQQISASDVTKQYTDTESELRGLRTMESRLIELIQSGRGEVKDLVEAEKQLGEYRVRIEKLEGEIRYYNNLVSLATITITAFEKDIQTPTAASVQEVVSLNVETEEVEDKYLAARAIFDEVKGRIVESQLKNTDAEHVAAHIVADVPPDKADFVAAQLKQLGKLASFNRDRKQITTGGTGAPPPNVQVEQKDTRITVDLYNLANLAPRETTVLRVAVGDVESAYQAILGQVRREAPAADGEGTGGTAVRAVGRVVASNITGQKPEQMQAEVRAMLRGDQADAVLSAIRASGEVLTSSVATNQDAAGTTSAKRGLQLSLVNIAAIPPKELNNLTIAVRDVDAAYNALLAAIQREAPAGGAAGTPGLLGSDVGRVLSSTITGQQAEQKSADIRAEIRADQAEGLLSTLLGAGETLVNNRTENPDAVNFTRAKRGLQVRLVHVAAVAPREARALRGVAENVSTSQEALLKSLAPLTGDGRVRILSSQLRAPDPRNTVATLALEARTEAIPDVERAFADAGIEMYWRTVARSNDTANTLESKVRYQVDEIRSAEAMGPKRTITLGREVEDVQRAAESIRGAIGADIREADYNIVRDSSTGRVSARLVLDMNRKSTPAVLDRIDALRGIDKISQIAQNNDLPDTPLARERVELVLTSRTPVLQPDRGVGNTLRAALTTASGALIYSLYLVITGLLFVLPFVLVIWPVWTLIKRRRKVATA